MQEKQMIRKLKKEEKQLYFELADEFLSFAGGIAPRAVGKL